jgi:WD40 repeat protein
MCVSPLRMNCTATMSVSAICLLLTSAIAANENLPSVTAVAFTPDGIAVVVGSQAGLEVRSWPELNHVRSLPTELYHVHDLAFSPDGKTLAVVGGAPAESGAFELLGWPSGELVHRASPHSDLIYAVDWQADSTRFATGSADRSVGIHDAVSAKTIQVLQGHSRGVMAVEYLPGQVGLATAGIDESLRLWDVANSKVLRTLPNHTRAVHDLAVCPIGSETAPILASIGADRTVRLWQPTLGRLMRFVRLKSIPLAVAWTDDGLRLVAACKDGSVHLIDSETVEVLKEIPAVDGVAYCLAVAPDRSVVVGGQYGQVIRVLLK